MPSLLEARVRLDEIIEKARVDLYKPIQIAEVLRRSRTSKDIDISDVKTYKNPSIYWRDEVTERLLGKRSSSSAQFQHNVWSDNAMPPSLILVLDNENQRTNGLVERYIYFRFAERQETVAAIFTHLGTATPTDFSLQSLLKLFVSQSGIRRSIDKAYEIVAYSVFETVVTALSATVRVRVPEEKKPLLTEFADLAQKLLGLKAPQNEWEQPAHIYRAGVTNAADRGLDMWANFGPAIQVKHLTLNNDLAESIIDQVESDHIVVVCRDADASVVQVIAKQISWGRRVRGIVTESDLVKWYDRCLRGIFAPQLAEPLLARLRSSFKAEFPQVSEIALFMRERGYDKMSPTEFWKSAMDKSFGV